MRYMSSSANKNRPKSYDGTNGGEKTEDKKEKRNEYLEALTNAYLRNGFSVNQQGENGNVDDYMRSQIAPSASISPINRQPTQRHILEVSASQQRQQELLQHRHCENKSAKSGRQRVSVPSATFVNYDTPNNSNRMVEQAKSDSKIELLSGRDYKEEICDDPDISGPTSENNQVYEDVDTKEGVPEKNRETVASGRKSRTGMRDREPNHPLSASQPNYLVNPHKRASKTRVQSAKGEKEVDNAIESIRELRQSLVSNATQQNLSPTAGGYIKRLMQETDRDIQELTNEIKHDIEMKKKMAEEHNDSVPDGEEVVGDPANYGVDSSLPEQFTSNGNSQPNLAPVFDRNNYVQMDELPVNETLMGKGYPEQWKNFATQDTSTMTDFKKPHGRKKQAMSNYPMSDRTYGGRKEGDSSQGNVNNNSLLNRRIPDNSVVESYQISALDKNMSHKDSHSNSASSKQSKSGANQDLRSVNNERNFQEQFHRKPKKGELRETNTTATPSKDSSRSTGGGQSVPPSVSDKYFEPSNRVRSAKGSQCKQPSQALAAEALPTKIQLMISQDHQEEKCFGGQFLPLSRTIRAPFYRSANNKKK